MNAHADFNQAEDLDGGLNALIRDAQKRLERDCEDIYASIRNNRAQLGRLRAINADLFSEFAQTRIELAHTHAKIMGTLPAEPIALTDETQVAPTAITAPQYRPSPDEFARVAHELTQGDRPPRFLQRAGR